MRLHDLRLLGFVFMLAAPLSMPVSAGAQERRDTAAQERQAAPANSKAPAAQDRSQGAGNSRESRHVRACKAKYRSYDARTDTYRTHSGQTRRCRL